MDCHQAPLRFYTARVKVRHQAKSASCPVIPQGQTLADAFICAFLL